MRVVELDRKLLSRGSLMFGGEEEDSVEPETVVAVFDRVGLPDGFPLVIDDDGAPAGCRYLNQYMLDALAQGGLDLSTLRRCHVYHLARLLRFLRRSRAEARARVAGVPFEDWLAEHGEPKVDLVEAARADLIAYRDSRAQVLSPSALSTEMGCLSGFFRYASERGWVDSDPIPRWAGRNTLMPRNRRRRIARFLTAEQTRHFLQVGLRGDGADPEAAPTCAERDYCYGLMLATTGLRREEGAFVLDCELPTEDQMPADGVFAFARAGKLGVTRTVHRGARPRDRSLPPD